MGYNKLNNQDAFAISAALRGNVNLRYLNLAGNKVRLMRSRRVYDVGIIDTHTHK